MLCGYWNLLRLLWKGLKMENEKHMDQPTRGPTLGESRVRVSFNLSGNSTVDEIKKLTAELIDKCKNLQGSQSPERARCFTLAMTDYESAAMWAVKGATS
jgi:hypothetical protein